MPKYRTKEVTRDGVTVTIGSLTMKEMRNSVAERLQALDGYLEAKKAGDYGTMRRIEDNLQPYIKKFVCISLNNADPQGNWTAEKLEEEFDELFYQWLYVQINEFLGIKLIPSNAAPGETSPTS